jgi:hypothetical protein
MDALGAMTTSPSAEPIVSALARRLHIPVRDVGAIYAKELARLAADARIEGFLSVLALRNTREILRDPAQRHFA